MRDKKEKLNAGVDEQFAMWLEMEGLMSDSIDKYIHYLAVVSQGFQRKINELVETEEVFRQSLSDFDKNVPGAASSRRTYKTAFNAYRDFFRAQKETAPLFPLEKIGEDKSWYRKYLVSDIHVLQKFVSSEGFAGSSGDMERHQWVFRGQGFGSWGLESSLGRCAYKQDGYPKCGSALKQHENDSMWEFSREASKYLEFRGYAGLNLLALMQHYGCKTRLLDFSLSPLVALAMAIDQNEDDTQKAAVCNSAWKKQTGRCLFEGEVKMPLALWAVDLNLLSKGADTWKESARDSFERGNRIVLRSENWHGRGISVVFPSLCNLRISAQNGLFLMAHDLDYCFEDNLRSALGCECDVYYAQTDLTEAAPLNQDARTGIVKVLISNDLVPSLKQLLADANVSAKTIYPDLMGLGKHVANMIRI